MERGSAIRELLDDVQTELRTGPSAWVARALARQGGGAEKFGRMEAADWEE